MDGDGRDDDDSVSRGGTPVPLSDGSGATPGGGAAGSEASEASEASERASASGTRDETTGDEDDGGSEDAHRDDSEAGAPPPRKSKKRRGALRPGRRRSEGRNAGEGAGSIEPR